MNKKIALGFAAIIALNNAHGGEGLYSVGVVKEDALPLTWLVGSDFIYDDNVIPESLSEDSSFALAPYVGASLVSISPQTTLDIYARLGVIYYMDAPTGMDDTNIQSRLGANIRHDFSERLQLLSNNFVTRELEPNYAYAYASSRQNEEHLYWNSDTSLGYRWTERLGTRTGVAFSGTRFTDQANIDRTSWQVYNQFRYVLSPQSILTLEYRYGQNTGNDFAADSQDQFALVGVEHRFSENTVAILKAGAQLREVDNGSDSSSPYLEGSLLSQVNEQFRIRGFMRYGIEADDTVHLFTPVLVEFDQRNTFRLGATATYDFTPMVSLFTGLDYVSSSFEDGRIINGLGSFADQNEDVINANIGLTYRISQGLSTSLSYTLTSSDSDLFGRDYDRNRISLGVNAQF